MGSFERGLDDEVDELLGEEVRNPEEGTGDDDETEDDRRRLTDLAAVRPLHALQLGPRGAEEVGEAPAAAATRVLRRRRVAAAGGGSRRAADRDRAAAAVARPAGGRAAERLLGLGLQRLALE